MEKKLSAYLKCTISSHLTCDICILDCIRKYSQIPEIEKDPIHWKIIQIWTQSMAYYHYDRLVEMHANFIQIKGIEVVINDCLTENYMTNGPGYFLYYQIACKYYSVLNATHKKYINEKVCELSRLNCLLENMKIPVVKCIVCYDERQQVELECEHMICGQCLCELHKNQCPLCRQFINIEHGNNSDELSYDGYYSRDNENYNGDYSDGSEFADTDSDNDSYYD